MTLFSFYKLLSVQAKIIDLRVDADLLIANTLAQLYQGSSTQTGEVKEQRSRCPQANLRR